MPLLTLEIMMAIKKIENPILVDWNESLLDLASYYRKFDGVKHFLISDFWYGRFSLDGKVFHCYTCSIDHEVKSVSTQKAYQYEPVLLDHVKVREKILKRLKRLAMEAARNGQ